VDERFAELDQAVSVSAVLGYVNFSDGRPDPRWQRHLDDAFAVLARRGVAAPHAALFDWLRAGLDRLRGTTPAFRDVAQAEAILAVAAEVPAAYRAFHADLLAHQDDAVLFNAFFLARVCEAALALRAAGDELTPDAVVARLNDFVGHRPVAILETRPQGEPYPHEWHRPVPLYLRGAGVAFGRYHDVVAAALDVLQKTPPDLLAEGHLDLALLDELALDARAYDHGHPANRRPNYVFGEWSPHQLDNQGRYRRYVVRQVTLDAMLARVAEGGEEGRGERLFEAAAVLAGTILMAAGVSGGSAHAHDSSTTLATLLPRIARYRDAFYTRLLAALPPGPLAERLRASSRV
jgi:hypothetical protein